MKQYDAIIIGFGKGGKPLAAGLANHNWEVTITEHSSQMYGGTCVSTRCIPAKTLIHELGQAEWFYRDNYDNQAKFYTSTVGRRGKLVSLLRDKNHEHLKSYPNITLYNGETSSMSNDTVKAAHDRKEIPLQGRGIFISTDSTPILPDVEGLNESERAFTSEALLRQNVLPKRLLILNVGAIGVGFAIVHAGFGSKITLSESGNRFMPKSDRDIAESMLEALKRKGIEMRLDVHVLSMYNAASGMTLIYTDNPDGAPYFLEEDALLLATGRRAVTSGLNLYTASVQTDTQGVIVVNGHLQTASPHIWAMGDVKGDAMYDYLFIDDFRITTNHLFDNKKRNMNGRLPMPYVIFTDPPLAHIGTTEGETVKRGYSIQVSRLPTAATPRAHTPQHIGGMLKVIVNAHTGRIIGCIPFCVDALEVINLVILAIENDLHYSALRGSIFTHPNMSEGLNGLFGAFQHLTLSS